ncbi:MAG TPA: cupin domain-containing protein [Candidatus Acidoferrum sp.]|nr:cupin domain-containing protein [Candidatus Acidoferrum sp.]
MTKGAAYWITKLKLKAHPEGGYYRQTYKADLLLAKQSLPPEFRGARSVSTAIYFLLEEQGFSAFHRLRSDEVWHFYVGVRLVVHVIDEEGRYSEILLGSDPERGEVPQAVVKAGSWFASRVWDGNRLRWWVVRWLRDLILKILNWRSGRSWYNSIRGTDS